MIQGTCSLIVEKKSSFSGVTINIDVVTCSPSELNYNFLDILLGISWFSKSS